MGRGISGLGFGAGWFVGGDATYPLSCFWDVGLYDIIYTWGGLMTRLEGVGGIWNLELCIKSSDA